MKSAPLIVVLAATMLVYWPVAGFEFSTWDDGLHVTENTHLNPPRIQNIGWFWVHPFQKLYIPLTYSAWTLVALVAQTRSPDITGTTLNPYVFHLANLLLHLLAVGTAYLILRHLFKRDWPAAIGAMLFAIHPIQVEAIAWVSGFRDLLSGLLSLIAIDQYIVAFDDRDRPNPRGMIHAMLALAACVAAMLAKPMAASLPIVLLSIDALILRRPLRRVAISVLPSLIVAIPIVIIARLVQPSEIQIAISPLWARPLIAGDALAFYLWKLVAPFGLAMDYGRTPQVVLAHSWIYATWMLPALIAITAWLLRRRTPWLFAGTVIAFAALLPVLGFIPFAFQAFSTVADRYTYLAMLGASIAMTGFLCATTRRGACAIATVAILALGVTAHRQVWIWRDDFSLYPHTLATNSNSFTANNNLAAALLELARPADAIPYAQRAANLNAAFALTWVNLADSLAAVGREREAIDAYRKALEIQPTHAAARAKLALALASVGEVEQAKAEYERAVRQDPDQKRIEPQLMEKIRARR